MARDKAFRFYYRDNLSLLRDCGASHVIVGHSERRADCGETDAVVRAQTQFAGENESLSEEVARLSSSIRIHNVALSRLGLVAATNVQYLTVHGAGAASR